jgi:hypothetical protein
MVERTEDRPPRPSPPEEREKRAQRLGAAKSSVVRGLNGRIFRGILSPLGRGEGSGLARRGLVKVAVKLALMVARRGAKRWRATAIQDAGAFAERGSFGTRAAGVKGAAIA